MDYYSGERQTQAPNRNQLNRANAAIKRLKRKNRKKSIWISILLIVVFVLLVVIAVGAWKNYSKKYKEPVHIYASMTEEATARAYVWLSKIEDTDISYEDVKACMGDFNIEIVKTPSKVKGEYTYSLADGAYEYCMNQATVGLEKAYKKAVCGRISHVGYEGELSDELVESLMQDTFGMSVAEYLKQCEITLLPKAEEIDIEKICGINTNETEGTDEKDK